LVLDVVWSISRATECVLSVEYHTEVNHEIEEVTSLHILHIPLQILKPAPRHTAPEIKQKS